VPRAAVEAIETTLALMTAAERRRLPTLERGREDVVVAGLAILRLAMDTFGAEAVQVSEYGLREGLLVDWAHRCLR
jgi:exopolyphosphatase/guanosine-5'-triphosphate,3'-diphosphate pyrophosphatase